MDTTEKAPYSVDLGARTPATYGRALAKWAQGAPTRLAAAAIAGNGRTENVFLHALPIEDVRYLAEQGNFRAHAELAKRAR